MSENVYVVIRVDSGLKDIVFEGGYDECLEKWAVFDKLHHNHIYIVRGKEETKKNIREGELL